MIVTSTVLVAQRAATVALQWEAIRERKETDAREAESDKALAAQREIIAALRGTLDGVHAACSNTV